MANTKQNLKRKASGSSAKSFAAMDDDRHRGIPGIGGRAIAPVEAAGQRLKMNINENEEISNVQTEEDENRIF